MIKISEDKRAELIELIEERRLLGISSGQADIEGSLEALEQIYASAGLKLKQVVRLPSPKACAEDYFLSSINKRNAAISSLRSVRTKLLSDVRRQFLLPEESSRPDELNNLLRRLSFFHQYSDFQSRIYGGNGYLQRFLGCCDISFLSFDCYLRLSHKFSERDLASFRQWYKIEQSCFCWWVLNDKVILCDRPISKWDGNDRLHCEDGPAVSFSDGNDFFYWHGVLVPERIIIAPESQSLEEIHDERNVELQRIRIERYGWQRYFKETDATICDTRRNDAEGTVETLMNGPYGRALVCACPSTGRVYFLQVPLSAHTCRQAQEWLSGGLSKRITMAT